MKCIECGTDNNLKDRTANYGSCKNCRHPFAFEPTSMATKFRFTDPFFAKAIGDISANDTLFFTHKQFLYFLDRRLKYRSEKLGCGFWLGYIFFGVWTTGFIGVFLSIAIGNWSFIVVATIFNLIVIIYLFQVSNSKTTSKTGRTNHAKALVILGLIISIGGAYLTSQIPDIPNILTIAIILALLSVLLGIIQLIRQKQIEQSLLVSPDLVREWLDRWMKINGSVEKILPSPRQESLPAQISSDISAYSFDRLVVCDSAAIAQFLIANNFHFENNCAVLSITGYPQSIFQTVLEMLRRNPNLKVYALHNCSPRGINLVHHLQTSSNWFSDTNVVIYDLGLSPRQVFKRPLLFVQNSTESSQQATKITPEVRQGLTPQEIKWLESGNFVELESFMPQKLLQIVTQGINNITNSDDTDYDSIESYDSFSDNSRIFLYPIDTFG